MIQPNYPKLSVVRGLRHARRVSGMSVRQIIRGYRQMKPVGHRMLLSEHLRFGLYRRDIDPTGYIGAAEAAAFALHINGPSSKKAVIADKLIFDAALRGLGFPVAPLQAMFGPRVALNVPALTNRADLRHFFGNDAAYPLFGKPLNGQNSRGVCAIAGYDPQDNSFRLLDGTVVPGWKVLGLIEKHSGYLLQSFVDQHAEMIAAIGPSVGTVRVMTFMENGTPHILGAFWKIPFGGMIADNLNRGSMLAPLDAATGRVQRVVENLSVDAGFVQTHPDTGAVLCDIVLPHWARLLETVQGAANVLTGLPLVGWDIAISPDGPVIIEANANPSLDLLQIGTGRGVLPTDMRARMVAEHDRLFANRARIKRANGLARLLMLLKRILASMGIGR